MESIDIKLGIIKIFESYEFDPASGWDSDMRHISSDDYEKIADEILKLINDKK